MLTVNAKPNAGDYIRFYPTDTICIQQGNIHTKFFYQSNILAPFFNAVFARK